MTCSMQTGPASPKDGMQDCRSDECERFRSRNVHWSGSRISCTDWWCTNAPTTLEVPSFEIRQPRDRNRAHSTVSGDSAVTAEQLYVLSAVKSGKVSSFELLDVVSCVYLCLLYVCWPLLEVVPLQQSPRHNNPSTSSRSRRLQLLGSSSKARSATLEALK